MGSSASQFKWQKRQVVIKSEAIINEVVTWGQALVQILMIRVAE